NHRFHKRFTWSHSSHCIFPLRNKLICQWPEYRPPTGYGRSIAAGELGPAEQTVSKYLERFERDARCLVRSFPSQLTKSQAGSDCAAVEIGSGYGPFRSEFPL